MPSPYLDQPLLLLVVVLPRLLDKIEAELADKNCQPHKCCAYASAPN
jgi:hypothetical protein